MSNPGQPHLGVPLVPPPTHPPTLLPLPLRDQQQGERPVPVNAPQETQVLPVRGQLQPPPCSHLWTKEGDPGRPRGAVPATPSPPWPLACLGTPGWGRQEHPCGSCSYANPGTAHRGRYPQAPFCLNKTFFMLCKKGVWLGVGGWGWLWGLPISGGSPQAHGQAGGWMAGSEDEFLLPPRSIPVLQSQRPCVPQGGCRRHTSCQSHISPSPSGAGRSGAAGVGGHSGSTCSAPGSTSLPRCSPCRWQQHLWGHTGGLSTAEWWSHCTHGCTLGFPVLPATTPPSRSTSSMAALMVPPVSTHWSTRRMRRPGGGRGWMSALCPHWQPPKKGSAPRAHLVRWRRCGPPSPSPGPSSRCRAVPPSAHRGARLCGWPGNLSAGWLLLQHLEEGTALSGPPGTRDRDPTLT